MRIIVYLTAIGVLLGIYVILILPSILNWGSTEAEQSVTWPGDDIVPNTDRSHTRAITINAPAEKVWPWIAQLGQDRGGFYTYDLIQNILGAQMPTSDFIRSNKQDWHFGSRLWMYPMSRANGVGFASVRTLEPGHALGFGTSSTTLSTNKTEDGSWTFILSPINSTSTRLIVRTRGALAQSILGVGMHDLVLEPIHFVMERRMMDGIKQLSEGHSRGRYQNHVQVILWCITSFIGFSSCYYMIRRWNLNWSFHAQQRSR